MKSKYELVWMNYFPDDIIVKILDSLRSHNEPTEFDVSRIKEIGQRSNISWNVGVITNYIEIICGNAAHLNCLAKIFRKYLQPGEELRLETHVIDSHFKLRIYFENLNIEAQKDAKREIQKENNRYAEQVARPINLKFPSSSGVLDPLVGRAFFYHQIYRLRPALPEELTINAGLYAVLQQGEMLGQLIDGLPVDTFRCVKVGMSNAMC